MTHTTLSDSKSEIAQRNKGKSGIKRNRNRHTYLGMTQFELSGVKLPL